MGCLLNVTGCRLASTERRPPRSCPFDEHSTNRLPRPDGRLDGELGSVEGLPEPGSGTSSLPCDLRTESTSFKMRSRPPSRCNCYLAYRDNHLRVCDGCSQLQYQRHHAARYRDNKTAPTPRRSVIVWRSTSYCWCVNGYGRMSLNRRTSGSPTGSVVVLTAIRHCLELPCHNLTGAATYITIA